MKKSNFPIDIFKLLFGVFAAQLVAFGLVLCACGLSFGLTGATPFSGVYSSSAARIA